MTAPTPTPRSIQTPEAELCAAQRLGRLGSWTWQADGDVTTWSEELYRIFGMDRSETPPQFVAHRALFDAVSWPLLKDAVDAALATGTPYCLELAYRRVDGGEGGWIETRGEPIRDAAGTVVGLRGTALEITERRRRHQADIALRVARESKRDRALLLREFSRSVRTSLSAVFGFAALLQKKVGADPAQQRWVEQIVSASRQIVDLLEEMERLDGAFFAAGAHVSALTPTETPGLQNLLANAPCPMLIQDRHGRIVHVSQALVESTGYAPEEIPTRSAWVARAYAEADAAEVSARLELAFETRALADAGERWVRTKSGELLRWHVLAAPSGVDPNGEPLVVSLAIDITDRSGTVAAAAAGA